MAAPLPPHVQAAVDKLVAAAPPLQPWQERLIQRNFGPRPALPLAAGMTAAQPARTAA